MSHKSKNWPTNGSTYNFGPFDRQGVEWHMIKNADHSVEIWISGPFGKTFHTGEIATIPPNPLVDRNQVHVFFSWENGQVSVRLNNQVVVSGLQGSSMTDLN